MFTNSEALRTSMSEQHYKAIAEIIWNFLPMTNITLPEVPAETILKENEVVVNKLADYFAADNPLFDCEKFMVACGLEK